MVEKPRLSLMDLFLITTCFLCLLTGFFIIIPQPYSLAVFWLVVSFTSYIPLIYLPFHVKAFVAVIQPTTQSDESDGSVVLRPQLSQRFAQQYNVSVFLTMILPLYSVNYLVSLCGGFNAIQTIVGYQILSVVTKGLFAAATMDIHLDALNQAQRALTEEQRANEARRNFLEYIFHEVHRISFTSYWI